MGNIRCSVILGNRRVESQTVESVATQSPCRPPVQQRQWRGRRGCGLGRLSLVLQQEDARRQARRGLAWPGVAGRAVPGLAPCTGRGQATVFRHAGPLDSIILSPARGIAPEARRLPPPGTAWRLTCQGCAEGLGDRGIAERERHGRCWPRIW